MPPRPGRAAIANSECRVHRVRPGMRGVRHATATYLPPSSVQFRYGPPHPGCWRRRRPAGPAAADGRSVSGRNTAWMCAMPQPPSPPRHARRTPGLHAASVSSARNPSVPRAMHSRVASLQHRRHVTSHGRGGSVRAASDAGRAITAAASAAHVGNETRRESRSYASRRRTMAMRVGRSCGRASRRPTRPNRSSNWGRSSPSSGLPLPTRTKRAGWRTAQTLALDQVLARRSDVDQQVHQVILQQVHLVHIQEAAVGAGEQAGLERASHPGPGRVPDQVPPRPGPRWRPTAGPRPGTGTRVRLGSTGGPGAFRRTPRVGDAAGSQR